MKPPPLVYERAESVSDAVAILAEMEWGARVIAGGQSLVPMLNLRLAPLIKLVDISRIEDLRAFSDDGGRVVYGACLRHGEFEDGAVPDCANGMMQRVASRIAYRAIRNRGTIGGSVALADPAADWITVLIALGAIFTVAGPTGRREIHADEMFLGPYTTALGEHDILCSISLPKLSAEGRTGFYKVIRKAGEYPMTTASVVRDPATGLNAVVLGAVNRPQLRLRRSSAILAASTRWSDDVGAALIDAYGEDLAAAGRDGDPYERKLCETTVLRAVQQALR